MFQLEQQDSHATKGSSQTSATSDVTSKHYKRCRSFVREISNTGDCVAMLTQALEGAVAGNVLYYYVLSCGPQPPAPKNHEYLAVQSV